MSGLRLSSVTPRAVRFFWTTVCSVVIADLIVGLGFLFQLPASTPTFQHIDGIIPLEIMGALLIMAAAWYFTGLFTARRTVMLVGLSLAAFVNLAFGVGFIESLFTGKLLGFPAIPLYVTFSLIHMFAIINLPPAAAIREVRRGVGK